MTLRPNSTPNIQVWYFIYITNIYICMISNVDRFLPWSNPIEYQINIYGSMAYGVCFNDSNCDICVELLTATSRSPCQIIKDINEVIMAQMTDVLTPFGDDDLSTETRSNKVMYRSKSLNVVFNFTTGLFTSAYKTSILLRAYMNLDERARVLALCLRYIAKVLNFFSKFDVIQSFNFLFVIYERLPRLIKWTCVHCPRIRTW